MVCVFLYVYWVLDGRGWCAFTWLLFPGAAFLVWGLYGNGPIGCTNNNYASREKCKKCGQPKEVTAMPAIAIPGVSLPTYSHYFSRAPGGLESKMSMGLVGNGILPQPHPLGANWLIGANQGHTSSLWPLASGLSYENPADHSPSGMKGWRNGDWICNCGFHNYSSRAQVRFIFCAEMISFQKLSIVQDL